MLEYNKPCKFGCDAVTAWKTTSGKPASSIPISARSHTKQERLYLEELNVHQNGTIVMFASIHRVSSVLQVNRRLPEGLNNASGTMKRSLLTTKIGSLGSLGCDWSLI